MAIKQLNEEQVRTMTLAQKDEWWLKNIFRGNMPQLTIRSALTGFILGGALSATNLYIGAKTGWSLGVGITSVILAFAFFRVLQSISFVRSEYTILENNAVQSIATSAGYMTAPLTSSLVAYMIVDGRLLPWWQMTIWMVVLSILGVLFAFPLKRRFINDEQQPFPEGRACGVVLDALHTADAKSGLLKAKVLGVAALFGAVMKFISAEGIQEFIQFKVLGRAPDEQKVVAAAQAVVDAAKAEVRSATPTGGVLADPAILTPLKESLVAAKGVLAQAQDKLMDHLIFFPENLSVILDKFGFKWPKIANIDIRQLTIVPQVDLALTAAGGLMGIRAGVSLLIGAVANYFIIVPWMASLGNIKPLTGSVDLGTATFGFRRITEWSLWPGVAIMVAASFVAFFAKPKVIFQAFGKLFGAKGQSETDVLKDIEVPSWVSFVGIPIFSLLAAYLAHTFFNVDYLMCLAGFPLMFILCLVAANSTAITGTTPVGATSKITQLFYGGLQPGNIKTNLATAGMTAEVVSNSSNLLMDIKPGYMLGAKPRQQIIGHIIGIFAGSFASVPLFFLLFTSGVDRTSPESIKETIGNIQSDKFEMPSVTIWTAVAKTLTEGLSNMHPSILKAVIAGAVIAVAMEVSRLVSKGRFPLSPVAIGLAFVLRFDYAFFMFLGAFIFWCLGIGRVSEEKAKKSLILDNHEPICAGVIAGVAILGIVDAVVTAFVLK